MTIYLFVYTILLLAEFEKQVYEFEVLSSIFEAIGHLDFEFADRLVVSNLLIYRDNILL